MQNINNSKEEKEKQQEQQQQINKIISQAYSSTIHNNMYKDRVINPFIVLFLAHSLYEYVRVHGYAFQKAKRRKNRKNNMF